MKEQNGRFELDVTITGEVRCLYVNDVFTVCEAKANILGQTVTGIGISRRAPEDEYSTKTAREYASDRAIHALLTKLQGKRNRAVLEG